MAATNQTERRVPLADLERRPEWAVLTTGQQAFLRAYITFGTETGNYHAPSAARAAYGNALAKNASIYAYEVLASPKVERILNLHFGFTEEEVVARRRRKTVEKLIRTVRFQLKHAEPGGMAAQRLTSQLQSLLLNESEPESKDKPAHVGSMKPTAPVTRVPPGATALVDSEGIVRGYRTAVGEYVQLAEIEIE